jgi:hypothetical protein
MMPSAAPTDSKCESAEGVYGDISGDSTVIAYTYELEASTTEELIIGEVLPALERAIVDSILSEVFEEDCGPGRRKLRVGRRLGVIGVSKNPDDSILGERE